MKLLSATCALLIAMAGPVLAQSDEMTPGRELADRIFGSMEENPAGSIDMGEFIHFGNDIFVSMDSDESKSISSTEFAEWDFGFNFIAEDAGQDRAYRTVQKILFSIWDHDGDGEIARREFHKSMVWDFRRADIDDDALLTYDEFMGGYVVIVAYRAAITGQ